jgi:hypothetical protein
MSCLLPAAINDAENDGGAPIRRPNVHETNNDLSNWQLQ